MLTLFQRKCPNHTVLHDNASPAPSLIPNMGAALLLDAPRREQLLNHIWQRTALSQPQYTQLYRIPLERYAELVQQFPASESHHHSYLGGMLDHGLEAVAYALKLRQSHLLPTGSCPEEQAAQTDAWTAATAYGALLHDIGKLAVDLEVEYADGHTWKPWHGPVQRPYRFRHRRDRRYRLHTAASGLLYRQILGSDILDWICQYPAPWEALLYVLAGQYEHAGTLGELVIQADRASVAQELGGDPARALTAPTRSLPRKLLDALRYLLHEEFKLNQPQASDGWLTEEALWLVSKTVSDKLRAYLLSQGVEGVPTSNSTLFDILQDHGIAQPTPDGKAIWKATITSDSGWSHSFTLLKLSPASIWQQDERPEPYAGTVVPLSEAEIDINITDDAPTADSIETVMEFRDNIPDRAAAPTPPVVADHTAGEIFIAWLRDSIRTGKLIINDAKALVHTVNGTVFLISPGIFQRYCQEHPNIANHTRTEDLADWQCIQKQFEKLSLHRKQENGLNIWACEIKSRRTSRRVHGYLLIEMNALLEVDLPNNPYLQLESDTPIEE